MGDQSIREHLTFVCMWMHFVQIHKPDPAQTYMFSRSLDQILSTPSNERPVHAAVNGKGEESGPLVMLFHADDCPHSK